MNCKLLNLENVEVLPRAQLDTAPECDRPGRSKVERRITTDFKPLRETDGRRCGRDDRTPPRSQHAFTLVEMMVATAIGVFVMGTMMVSFVVMNRTFSAMGNYADLDKQSRNTLNIMSRDIRNAAALTNWTTNVLGFTNVDGGTLTYTYQPTNHLLTYTNTSTTNGGVLLSNCISITFTLFQRTPTNGTMAFYVASNASSAKGILMSFSCIRTNYLGVTVSETIETASIVMRN